MDEKETAVSQTRSKRSASILTFLVGIALLIFLNVFSSFVFKRFDLTADHRFSLTDASKGMMANLEDVVYIKIYLDGELPAQLAKLKNECREMLNEFRAYSNGMLQYEFINPAAEKDPEVRKQVYAQLEKQGLQYTNVTVKEGEKLSELIVFPGAVFSYQGNEKSLQLMEGMKGTDMESMIHTSIGRLEYQIASTIKSLSGDLGGNIAFIEGHGEYDALQTADIARSIKGSNKVTGMYKLHRISIDEKLGALDNFKLAIIAGPDSSFSEKDKFIIDQFVMNGGRLIWLLDAVYASLDSLQNTGTSFAISRNLNLDDMLFRYGVRINPNLVMDLQALPIPIVTGMQGDQPKQELIPWPYYPLIVPQTSHAILQGVDGIMTSFCNDMDTLGSKDIKKTVLLETSQYSRISSAPTRVSINMLREPPQPELYDAGPKIISVLLEGKFKSLFKNRIPPQISEDKSIGFKDSINYNKMIVISDADIIKNQIDRKADRYFDLGYDRYTRQVFGNKDFLLNAINYLCDDSELLVPRNKSFALRLLDKAKIDKDERFWQVLNVASPVALVLLLGIILVFIRRKRFL